MKRNKLSKSGLARPFLISGTLLAGLAGCNLAGNNDGPVVDIQKASIHAAEKMMTTQVTPRVIPPLAALGPVPVPPGNPITPEKVELGKKLFFDGRLGGDGSTACVNCHLPFVGWDFPQDVSPGYSGTIHWRNSPTIVNSAYYDKLFWTGSSRSLENQARSAARDSVVGNGDDDLMEARLALIPEYVESFNKVFGDDWPKIGNAWMAIAAFERTLVQRDTPLDKYLLGNERALTEAQKRGKDLFEGKAGCINCHNGALASNQEYYNIGVPPIKRWEEDPLAQITFRWAIYDKGASEEMYRTVKADPGAYFHGKFEGMKGRFRVPSLRYTKYTAPYMHNGALPTLEAVVDFYDRGGFDAEGRTTWFPETKSDMIKPLGLSAEEKADLVAFLKSFTGEKINMDNPKLPEYAPRFSDDEISEEMLKEAKK